MQLGATESTSNAIHELPPGTRPAPRSVSCTMSGISCSNVRNAAFTAGMPLNVRNNGAGRGRRQRLFHACVCSYNWLLFLMGQTTTQCPVMRHKRSMSAHVQGVASLRASMRILVRRLERWSRRRREVPFGRARRNISSTCLRRRPWPMIEFRSQVGHRRRMTSAHPAVQSASSLCSGAESGIKRIVAHGALPRR